MITIGPWAIMKLERGGVWIRHEDGQGYAVNEQVFAGHISKFNEGVQVEDIGAELEEERLP